MKLSIICPIYRQPKQFERFLDSMDKQSNQDFELVFVVDTNTGNDLATIDSYKKRLRAKVKIIYNFKRVGRINAVQLGVRAATNEFVYIATITDTFREDAIERFNSLIEKQPADIIEFMARLKTPISFQGMIRKPFNQETIIKEHPEIIAYSYPFDFNKIFRKLVLEETLKVSLGKAANTRFSVAHVIRAFYVAKTYSNADIKIARCKSEFDEDLNTLAISREWKALQEFIENNYDNKWYTEYSYAKFFHSKIFLTAFTAATKNKILMDKFEKMLDKEKTFATKTNENNKYFIQNDSETKVLSELKGFADMAKAYKKLPYV